MKNRMQKIILSLVTTISLASCSSLEPVYEKEGLHSKVIYDLGEGYKTGRENEHTLTVQYAADSYITDFSKIPGYELVYAGHNIEGWYFDAEYTQPVPFTDFKTTANSTITIYAKWQENIVRYFDIYYKLDGELTYNKLKEMEWQSDIAFSLASAKLAYPTTDLKQTYTLIDAYTDEACTQPLDNTYVLGGENKRLPIYTNWLVGDYKIVRTAKQFKDSFGTYNVYLMDDIDMTGISYSYPKLLSELTILGNGHTVSNLTITGDKGGSSKTTVTYGMIAGEVKKSTVKDIHFTNVDFTISANICAYLNFGAFAGNIEKSKFENVTLQGSVHYTQVTLDRINKKEEDDSSITKLGYYKDYSKLGYTMDEDTTTTNCTITIHDDLESEE